MTKLSRSSSPVDYDYESYENTRETTRLRTEIDLHVAPKASQKDARVERLISRIRFLLRVVSFLIASSVVGILAYTVWLYRATKNEDIEVGGKWNNLQSVWVSHLKMRPTYVLLGVSSAAALLSLVVVVANFSKMVRRITDLSNVITVLVASIGLLLWLGAGIWYKRDDWNRAMNMDVTSYLCRHQGNRGLQQVLGKMGVLCGALRFAWWAVVVASSIELLSIVTVIWGIVVARKGGVYRKI